MGLKEIKQLYNRIKRQGGTTQADSSFVTVKENKDLNVAGLVQLRIFKNELQSLYK